MVGLLVLLVCAFALVAHASMAFFDQPTRQQFVGAVSMASLISMFASPLAVMVRHPIKLVSLWKFLLDHPFYVRHRRAHRTVLTHVSIVCSSGRGDQDGVRGVHALLPLALHAADERLFRDIRSAAAWSLHLCKQPDSISNCIFYLNRCTICGECMCWRLDLWPSEFSVAQRAWSCPGSNAVGTLRLLQQEMEMQGFICAVACLIKAEVINSQF